MSTNIIEHKGLLFWFGMAFLAVWMLCIIPGLMPLLSSTYEYIIASLAGVGLMRGIIMDKKTESKNGAKKVAYKFVIDWKDWMGLIILLLVLYAIRMHVDPVLLITEIGKILKGFKTA